MVDFSAELDALWDFNDPLLSENRFREAARGEHRAEALTQLARALGLQKKFTEGLKVLDEAKAIGGGVIVDARVALEHGRILLDKGEDPVREFQSSLEISILNHLDIYAIDAMHMLAICASGDEAISWNKRAIEAAESSKSERARQWRASLLNNLGWSYFDVAEFADALNCFERAVPLREQRGQAKETDIARWCVSRTLRALGRLEEALSGQYALLASDETGFVYEEIGECLLSLGHAETAKPYFAESFLRLGDKVDNDRLKRLEELGCGCTFGSFLQDDIRFIRSPNANDRDIWNLVGTAEGLSAWLGIVSGSIDTPNAEFAIHIDGNPEDEVRCRVIDYHPPKSLTLEWDIEKCSSSVLSFEVSNNRLILNHKNPSDLSEYGAAWHSSLDLLQHVLAGKPKDTFIENYSYLIPEYQRLTSNRGTQ